MNIRLWLLLVLYFVFENMYFGWNATPQSDAEMICDAFGFVLAAVAILGRRK